MSETKSQDGRWKSQTNLVERIAKITTRVLPQDEGVALRFINHELPDSSLNLRFDRIKEILNSRAPDGGTKIGRNLEDKILKPLIFEKLNSPKGLERPVLISILTDGEPESETADELINAIVECGQKLNDAVPPYPRESAYCNHTCASC